MDEEEGQEAGQKEQTAEQRRPSQEDERAGQAEGGGRGAGQLIKLHLFVSSCRDIIELQIILLGGPVIYGTVVCRRTVRRKFPIFFKNIPSTTMALLFMSACLIAEKNAQQLIWNREY